MNTWLKGLQEAILLSNTQPKNMVELVNTNKYSLFNFVPTSVEGFIDRQQEMESIIDLVHNNKIVSIVGQACIGKTSIARNLANYMNNRRKFKDRIIYVRFRGWESAQMFMSRLSLWIRYWLANLTPEQLMFVDESEVDNIEKT